MVWFSNNWVPDRTNGHQHKWVPQKWAPGQMGHRQIGQGNNCPGPICPRITNTAKTALAQDKRFVQLKVEQF